MRGLLAYVEMYLYQDHFSESLSHAETRSLRSPLQDWPLKYKNGGVVPPRAVRWLFSSMNREELLAPIDRSLFRDR